jgi:2-oxoglutarate dehydrogenase E2 component (dihydrolipoamide succinyltransferase)
VADFRLTVPLPHMGVSVEEGTVVAWHKTVGDTVQAGEPLCEISTDKVETEITAPADGVLARILAEVGDTVAVGGTLAEMVTDEAGAVAVEAAATAPAQAEPGSQPEPEPKSEPGPASAPGSAVAAGAPALSVPARFDPARAGAAALDQAANGRPITSPVARRLAAEHGIELRAVTGSGRRGRIRKADVLAAISAGGPAPPAARSPAAAPAAPLGTLPRGYDDVPNEIIPTSRLRRLTAEHMIRSRQTAAHMTTEAEVDMAAALRARAELNAPRLAAGLAKLTPLALIARAACVALAEYPALNASFETERMIHWGDVNLGIAVDTPEGLIVPVIRGAQRLTAPALADAIADLARRARERALTPDDVRAGTFTISNPGSVGAHSAMAIINQPQVAILGLPAIVRRPTVITDAHGEETLGIRPLMMLALTFDHRAIDGAYATRAVVRIRVLLESWTADDYA